MEKRTVVVCNATGVHMRPSGLIAKTAGRFESQITLRKLDESADAKSMMDVLALAMTVNEFIDIETDGPDEQLAADTIAQLFEDRFGEWSLYD